MTKHLIKILHLEDDQCDAELIKDKLAAIAQACEITVVDSEATFRTALRTERFDLVLCDYNLPDYDGMAAVTLAKDTQAHMPVIVISGTVTEDVLVGCLQAGAADFLLKERLERLGHAVQRAVGAAESNRRRLEAEAALRESEERFRQLANQSSDGFWFMSANQQRIIYVSPVIERTWGLPAWRFYQDAHLWIDAIHPDDRSRIAEAWDVCFQGESLGLDEQYRVVRPDGSVRWVSDSVTCILNDAGEIIRYGGIVKDITERTQLEAQFLQAQKMEIVGQLAGGIAHDFNNLLTVMMSTAELIEMDLSENDPVREELATIRGAGTSAAALTRQLLAFSRKQILQPVVANLNVIVANLEPMLRRVIAEDIALTILPGQNLASVTADPAQIEQVVLNIALNSRDAMPDGGKLTIATANVMLDETYAKSHQDMRSGPHVMLAISDTGIGMDEATQRKIFEPFFTTKEPGKGTGLGLSTAYGIVKQSGGDIRVDSEVGKGTTFKIFLPVSESRASRRQVTPPIARATRGSETILVVEDDERLRRLAERILVSAGYTVLVAANGEQAVQTLERHDGPVHMVFTDVVMPGMSGGRLRETLAASHPAMKILFTSGYTDDTIIHHGVLAEGVNFIAKPYTMTALTRAVRQVLDS